MEITLKNFVFGVLILLLIFSIYKIIEKINKPDKKKDIRDKYDKYGNKLKVETEAELLGSGKYDRTNPRVYLGPDGRQVYERNYVNLDLGAKKRLGTPNASIDWKNKNIKEFEFGGAGGIFYNDLRTNPATDDITCPDGFYKNYLQPPGDLSPSDHDFFCYKPIMTGDKYDPSKSNIEFGGAYGEYPFVNSDGDTRDPATETGNLCPSGFNVLNVPGRGNGYNICYRKKANQDDWGTNKGRKPFGGFQICRKYSDDGIALPCEVECLDGYSPQLLSQEAGYRISSCVPAG
jgi:hypothetical protein